MIKKYYEGTPRIINLSIEIGKLLGAVDSTYLRKPKTELRKENRIRTIQSSLQIEGNTLSLEQVSAIFDNKVVTGPPKDIKEVQNAIELYENLLEFDPYNEKSYLVAHKLLMRGLIQGVGKYRTKGVGIFKGNKVTHMAPPAKSVKRLMKDLFAYLKESGDNLIIKSCVFHYEMEYIHPFMDGNGRMGRLWQTILLMKENPVFEYLPIETEIRNRQEEYYRALSISDKQGISTQFVEFMLGIIKKSLEHLLKDQRSSLTDQERINYFQEHTDKTEFTRKDYLNMFKNISTATATRDLKKGVALNLLIKNGDNRISKYVFRV